MEKKVTVVGIRFKAAGKMYYFDPANIKLELGDNVIVETARGLEFGEVCLSETQVSEDDIFSPLKPVIRLATAEDKKHHQENEAKKAKALKTCEEKILARGLEMKLIDVEFTFDDSKVIFYFTADGRVDFRELVKDLASVFRMRIELRQIGVRDEAKMVGGIGACGRELCCASWMGDFQPVSIKMAKTQNLSLNPTKISGICGRLMCCLNYEDAVYKELKKGMPDANEIIKTPDGKAKVVDANIFTGKIRVVLMNEHAESEDDKFSTDISTYERAEIRRLERKGQKPKKYEDDDLAGLSAEEKREMEKLMKEN